MRSPVVILPSIYKNKTCYASLIFMLSIKNIAFAKIQFFDAWITLLRLVVR